MSESCNSRHFSWLMKPCRPNPHDPPPICPCATISIPSHSSNSLLHHSAKAKTAISLLPDDLLLEILSRLPLSSLPSLPLVCRRWSHLLDTPDFLYLRRHHRLLHPTLYALSLSDYGLHVSSVRLDLNQASWKTSLYHPNGTLLCPSDLHGLFSNARLVSVGRKIFILTRNQTAQYDSWTGSVRFKTAMLFPRKKFAAAVLGGKIYVAGGAVRTSAVEEFDPHKNTWRVVTDAPRRRYGCIGVGINGVFYVIGGFKIGGGINSSHSNNRIRSLEKASISRAAATVIGNEARIYASSMDLYDVDSGNWLRSRAVPGGGCVVAACGAYDHVYVLASHAVELSFWRFHGRRKNVTGCSIAGGSNRGGVINGGGGFGEWCRMKSPPLPPQVRLDSMVRFCCVGMEDKVVMIQVTGCIDDLLRRSGRGGGVRGNGEGLVLVFDCVTGEWSRGADLPHVIQRAACVCLEC